MCDNHAQLTSNTGSQKVMTTRYVPPGTRSKGTQGCNSVNQAEDSQRSLDELIAKDEETDVFTVKLRSDNAYSKDCKDYK